MILTRLRNLFRRLPTPKLPQIQPLDNKKVTPDERQLLAAWLDLPMTKKALGLVEGERLTAHVPISGDVAHTAAREIRRLHLLQGWELYHKTLLSLRHSPQQVAKMVAETYPTLDP